MDISLQLLAGLAGFGYFLNKDGKRKRENIKTYKNVEKKKPNSYNVYHSDRFNDVKQIVQEKADEVWQKGLDSANSNIIPSNFNSGDWESIENTFQERPLSDRSGPQRTEMTHNNMVPFFGGTMKQNTNVDQNSYTLDLFTGGDGLKPKKKEVESIFAPHQDAGNPFGVVEERDTSRFVPALTQQGIKPFQEERVGPGLNQGFTSDPSGGFHNTFRPQDKTVDQLRTATNPKKTYEGRILPPKSINSNRGKEAIISKNRPDTFYKVTKDMLFKTTGAFTKEKKRSKVILRDTNRKCSQSYTGIAGAADKLKGKSRSIVQKDRNKTYKTTGSRNLSATGAWTVKGKHVDPSDYGKGGFRSYPNERQITGKRVHSTNLKSSVNRAITRPQDKFKTTRKQRYVTYSRRGNVKMQGSKQHQVYYFDKARTTIKETNVHDNRTGFIGPQRPGQMKVYNPKSKFRTTVRETTENNRMRLNLKGTSTKNHQVYRKLDKPRITIRETTEDDGHVGHANLEGMKSGSNSYNKEEWKMKTTHRNVNPNSRYGSGVDQKPTLTGSRKHIVYDPNNKAKVTHRQTTIETKGMGGVNAQVLQSGRGYIPVNKNTEAPNTNRQFTSDHEYTGVADSNVDAQMSYNDMYNAETNAQKEVVAKGRAPTQNSVKVPTGSHDINVEDKNVRVVENDRENTPTKVYQETTTSSANNCQITKISTKDDSANIADRVDPDVLKAFKENPYTQSLSSA